MVDFGKNPENVKQLDNSAGDIKDTDTLSFGSSGGITTIEILENPVFRSCIYVNNDDSVTLSFQKPRPNAWWRLWHWVFFGIKWERIEE